jgi:hypothetical protein
MMKESSWLIRCRKYFMPFQSLCFIVGRSGREVLKLFSLFFGAVNLARTQDSLCSALISDKFCTGRNRYSPPSAPTSMCPRPIALAEWWRTLFHCHWLWDCGDAVGSIVCAGEVGSAGWTCNLELKEQSPRF